MTGIAGKIYELRPPMEPGSNRRANLARGDWRFLLSRTEGIRALYMGLPSAGELTGLSQRATVTVATHPAEVDKVRDMITRESIPNVWVVSIWKNQQLPIRAGTIDLVAFPKGIEPRDLLRPPAAHRDVHRVLSTGGTVYLDTRLPGGGFAARYWGRKCVGRKAAIKTYWTVRHKGSVRAILPIETASGLARYFFQNALYGRSVRGRALMTVARVLARMRILHWAAWHRSTVFRKGASDAVSFPYLRRMGERIGLDYGQKPIAFLAGGSYDSNKNAFFVFPEGSARPDTILKITRTPAYNHRLEREYHSLSKLKAASLAPPDTYPEAIFLDYHEGLAVVAEEVVEGAPFRATTTAAFDCPAAAGALDWIVHLSRRSSVVADGNRHALNERFHEMLQRLVAIYGLPAAERSFLLRLLQRFRAVEGEIPLVFRHGDAGTWNILITESGSPAFLDWEISEPYGPPLWDLLDFSRSFTNWIARVRGMRNAVVAYERLVAEDGAASEYQHAAVARYRATMGLLPAEVETLFYFYWVDRALRQAAWTDGPLQQATYLRLLRICVRERGSGSLSRLFDGDRSGVDPSKTELGSERERWGPPAHSEEGAGSQRGD